MNAAVRKITRRQPYPRSSDDYLADLSIFPIQNPPIKKAEIITAIKSAFSRTMQDKRGKAKVLNIDSKNVFKRTIEHLKQRSDPVLTPYFYSQCEAEKIFLLDATSHEMQILRMRMGNFYQFLVIELMRASSNVIQAFDGSREGDVIADINAVGVEGGGIRLYISVKKSVDTVGGQDIKDAIHRLEDIALADKNLNSPYICVLFHANPVAGKSKSYENDRSIRRTRYGDAFSSNAEFWGPDFFYKYVTGHDANKIYSLCREEIKNFYPVLSLKFETECTKLFLNEMDSINAVQNNGFIDSQKFYDYISS